MPARQFVVTMDVPPGVSVQDAKDYIAEAVQSWSGSFKPPGADDADPAGDPRFALGRTARVKALPGVLPSKSKGR